MELDLDITDLREIQLSRFELKSFLRIGERVVPTSSPESGISWFLTCLDSSEECLESKIYSFLHILKSLGKDLL